MELVIDTGQEMFAMSVKIKIQNSPSTTVRVKVHKPVWREYLQY
jgi:hypothetical protein